MNVETPFPKSWRRLIRHCKTCQHKCNKEKPIVGCESVMMPYSLQLYGREISSVCVQRTWFNKNHEPVKKWPTNEQITYAKLVHAKRGECK